MPEAFGFDDDSREAAQGEQLGGEPKAQCMGGSQLSQPQWQAQPGLEMLQDNPPADTPPITCVCQDCSASRKKKQVFCAVHITHKNALHDQLKKQGGGEFQSWKRMLSNPDNEQLWQAVERFATKSEEEQASGRGRAHPHFSVSQSGL